MEARMIDTLLSFTGDTFNDPSTGCRMRVDRWYVLATRLGAGNPCWHRLMLPYGFESFADAENAVRLQLPAAPPLLQPDYLPAVGDDGKVDRHRPGVWSCPLLDGSVVFGRDVFNFWASNNRAALKTHNRELFA
jgi:hypothetical protein